MTLAIALALGGAMGCGSSVNTSAFDDVPGGGGDAAGDVSLTDGAGDDGFGGDAGGDGFGGDAGDAGKKDSAVLDSGVGVDTGVLVDTGGTCGKTLCSGACVDLDTDPRHCGDCGNACDPKQSCEGGKCVCAGTDCDGTCTDTNTDPKNCGGCGRAVCHDEVCEEGRPACAPGFRECGGGGCLGCKEVSSDPLNCGGCGTRCLPSQACAKGVCVSGGCPTGLAECSGPSLSGGSSCVNFRRDLLNCGSCGVQCSPGQFCVEGACTDFSSGPGCSTCPCATCGGGEPLCCDYPAGKGIVCSSACPAK